MIETTESQPQTSVGDILAKVIADVAAKSEERKNRREERDETSHDVYGAPEPRVSRLAVKGAPVYALANAQVACASQPIDCRRFNSLVVMVFASGTNPSATVTIEGGPAAGGPWLPEPWLANGFVASANVAKSLEIANRFCRIVLSNVSGTFGQGQGFTVIATPYVSGVGVG